MPTPLPVLRPFQQDALRALARDPSHVLCVSPTGSGKSLIFERMAARPGMRTLLVTPLLALARQQVSGLRGLGIEARLGAGPRPEDAPERNGVWILSPERLASERNCRILEAWRPGFLVVDECHCIWEWGERFRPAFRMIPELLRDGQCGIRRSLWLTATLPPDARLWLRSVLPQGLVELGGFELPAGIDLSFHHIPWSDRDHALAAVARRLEGPGIVFVFSRSQAEGVARLLRSQGHRAVAYHAGMSLEEKRAIEVSCSQPEGPRILVGTSALGLGLNLEHLRWVLLRQAPLSLLSLAQSIGRVARGKGGPWRAIVLWSEDDFQLMDGVSSRELSSLAALLGSRECRRVALSRCFGAIASRCGSCDHCNSCQY